MKSLIALAIIAAGAIAADSKAVEVGQPFQAPDDIADKLIADGLAKEDAPAPPAATKTKTVKARVLFDGHYGRINEVADIPADVLKALESDGHVDSSKAAVAYALSLAKPSDE